MLIADYIRSQLVALIDWAGMKPNSAASLTQSFLLLTRESLDQPVQPCYPGLSYINANGLPFQWVLRFGSDLNGLGFLCEVGTPGELPTQRFTKSLHRLDQVCEAIGSKRPLWLRDVAARLVPRDHWPLKWRSAMWIGIGASANALLVKPYFNLNRDSARERWLRVGWVLQDLGRSRSLEYLCALSTQVSAGSWPVGIAIDVRPDGTPGRVKVYFRSEAVYPLWLQHWYSATGYDSDSKIMRCCLDSLPLTGNRPYPAGAFIVSIEFHPSDHLSIKTDLAVTKWVKGDQSIVPGARRLIAAVGGESDCLEHALAAVGAWPVSTPETSSLRFIGLGSEPDKSCHVNVYVEPPLLTRKPRNIVAGAVPSISAAITRGLYFLSSQQRDAHWTDFKLPTGESNAWVTAFILTRLAELPHESISATIGKQIEQALDWLQASRSPSGGWGYNETVDNDADSTSWAILALRRFNRSVPAEALNFLYRCRRTDGTVATFAPESGLGPGWTQGVPDVTAVGVKALEQRPDASTSLFTRWLQPDGTLPAYWWSTPLYTAAEVLDWAGSETTSPLVRRLAEGLSRYVASTLFEEALLLRCLVVLQMKQASTTVATRLCSAQRSDGAWPSAALLRLTVPEVIEPWRAINAGRLYPDHQSLFTTATILSALGRYQSSWQE